MSGMRGKIGLTMLGDGSWGAAYGQALNTWIAKAEDNPRLPGEAGIEAICQRAFAVLASDSDETASQVFDEQGPRQSVEPALVMEIRHRTRARGSEPSEPGTQPRMWRKSG